ncbi:chemotaxis signal transduction protein CheV [Ectothiorhodospiraceae bacterium BW-2]|nr:chemotaxis signal transduction protein CheV [Ectothiorhodospiraceae bacterium BW-2]
MAGILDDVDRRTQLAGHNRMELLLFHLGGRQYFGINVFKIKEVIQCPRLTTVPHSHYAVRGMANMRGKTITVIDLSMAIGHPTGLDISSSFVIITEYNRNTQGFLVAGVERIVNLNWDSIKPPPKGAGNTYMTAVTEVDKRLIEIIDVEKVLSEIIGVEELVAAATIEQGQESERKFAHKVLIVDDSSVARNQIKHTLDQVGVESTMVKNGREGFDLLKGIVDSGESVYQHFQLVICDVEMPEMDGYTFTRQVKERSDMSALHIILHTSLSGVFNEALVKKVGADHFISKFNPTELANAVLEVLNRE